MLDVIVLIAMAVTAVAFAVGLIVHSGIAQIPALIAAAALYMVMAASYLLVARASRSGVGGDRLHEIEEALEIIDKDLQRIDRVEDDVARLDVLAERVERLDQALGDQGVGERRGTSRQSDFSEALEDVHAKIDRMRFELEGQARNQRDKITSDLRALEALIKQLSHDLIEASAAEAARAALKPAAAEPRPVAAEPAPVAKPVIAEVKKIEPDEPELALEDEPLSVVELDEAEMLAESERPEETVTQEESAAEPRAESVPAPARALKTEEEAPEPPVVAPANDAEMLDIVSQAIESGRVDLYLQPTVTLPERRPVYFEALTRIRTGTGELILPGSYLKVAEASGLMPLIDNVLLVKSVQTLRRLGQGSPVKAVFCNISVKTLLDPEFFPELVEFMEENSSLSESLIFEIGQSAMRGLSEDELGALDTLGALGYGFSLDHVTDLDIDFATLRDRYFRFMKLDAKIFLHGLEAKGSHFSASEMKRALGDFDMKLIVEKVEEETEVGKLLDHGVELAQGYLFGKPKPMSPALFREIENADAA